MAEMQRLDINAYQVANSETGQFLSGMTEAFSARQHAQGSVSLELTREGFGDGHPYEKVTLRKK